MSRDGDSYGQVLYHLGLALDALEKVEVSWGHNDDLVYQAVQQLGEQPKTISSERVHQIRLVINILEALVDEYVGDDQPPQP